MAHWHTMVSLVFGEHVAYGVNSAFILLDHVREFLLIVIHFYSYFNDLHELDATS